MPATSSHGALIDSPIAASNIPHTPLANTFTSQWPQEERFQTISAQQEYADLSLEELRLADYQKSNGLLSGHADNHEAKAPNQLFQQKPQLSKNTGSNLELYVLQQAMNEIRSLHKQPHRPRNHSQGWHHNFNY